MTDRRVNTRLRAIVSTMTALDRAPLLKELRERGRVIEAQAELIRHYQTLLHARTEPPLGYVDAVECEECGGARG